MDTRTRLELMTARDVLRSEFPNSAMITITCTGDFYPKSGIDDFNWIVQVAFTNRANIEAQGRTLEEAVATAIDKPELIASQLAALGTSNITQLSNN